ncbi:hypothetical protein [Rhodomicrobium lacus]|uniref:hypothetical protein n=1 Tax=Rhodomicrobium lacus TaxID=2498452 RepID=UPI000F8F685A|nr:hypothetical protein [Rhodomicrobium lacus]
MTNALKVLGIIALAWVGFRAISGPSDAYLEEVVAIATVQQAFKPATVTFLPLVKKTAPDGATIIGGTATARRQDFVYQIRVEKVCGAHETLCFKPKLIFLKNSNAP